MGSTADEKLCRDCVLVKPLDEFPRNARREDGRGSYCRDCVGVRSRKYRRDRAMREGRTIRERVDLPEGMKRCPRCERLLSLDAFGRNRSGRGGRTAYCRPCHNAVGKASRERLYGSTREYHLRRRYGIGSADVAAMIERQGGVCAACGVDEPKHVDHDHATGKVRGILCFLCNQALGNVRDDVMRLLRLVNYLHRTRESGRVVQTYLPPGPIYVDFRVGHRAA